MRRAWIVLIMIPLFVISGNAVSYSAPTVPNSGSRYMPDETESFGEGVLYIVKTAIEEMYPAFSETISTCASCVAIALLTSVVDNISQDTRPAIHLAGICVAALCLLRPAQSMIRLGTNTILEVSQYGKLLLPVMTGALVAQGAVSKSGVLYTATAFFDTILSSGISNYLTPLVYVFLCLSIVSGIAQVPLLKQIKDGIQKGIAWGLKTILYVFTGYISITGVVSGSTDAAMLKATKLTISSMVPVVGGILSDASEAVLVSAGLVKNAVGVYGLLAIIAIGIGPFLRIAIQYFLLKFTAGVSDTFGVKPISDVIQDYSHAMGLVLGMLGTVCIIQLISTICFLRGVS